MGEVIGGPRRWRMTTGEGGCLGAAVGAGHDITVPLNKMKSDPPRCSLVVMKRDDLEGHFYRIGTTFAVLGAC